MPQPVNDLLVQIGANTGEVGKALPASEHVFCLFRPQKGTAGGASECPLQGLLCVFSRPGQQFGDIGISHVVLEMPKLAPSSR